MQRARIRTMAGGWLTAGLVAGAIGLGPLPLAAQDGERAAQRSVTFLTQRDRTGREDPARFFGEERGTLSAGRCDIAERRIDLLAGVAEAAPFYVPEEILRVAAIRPAPVDTVLDDLERSVDGGRPLLYTHGFYMDFEKGCRRASILQENAGLQGRFLWFSWPSDGSMFNYTHDEADLYWSVLDMSQVILDLEDRFGPGRINLSGHSLGARGMVLAIHDVAAQRPDAQLGEVVLLAPDMDFGVFARLLPRIRPIVTGITIYVAKADRPLALSEQVHGYPRLGQTGNDWARLEGVEVVDLSDLPVRSATGHLYHIYNAEVGADLDLLLNGGQRAGDRPNLVPHGPNLWRMRPAE